LRFSAYLIATVVPSVAAVRVVRTHRWTPGDLNDRMSENERSSVGCDLRTWMGPSRAWPIASSRRSFCGSGSAGPTSDETEKE
jgi:hypothetical protein